MVESFDPAAAKEGQAPVQDRLMTTFFLAGLFHGIVILGVSFGVVDLPNPDGAPAVEVLLVGQRPWETETHPEADYIAQRHQLGAGNAADTRTAHRAGSPLPPGAAQAGTGMNSQPGQKGSAENIILNQELKSSVLISTPHAPAQEGFPLSDGPETAVPASEEAVLSLKGREAHLLLAPNTRASELAVYLDGWKRKVERIGTLHFPRETRRRGLSGNPVLEVAVRANGQLVEAVVRRSSGHAELDQAALGILKLASPFDPFPAELRARHSELRFAYEWQFLGGKP